MSDEKTPTRTHKESRLRWLEKQRRAVEKDLKAAREAKCWSAVQNLYREARTHRQEADEIHMSLAVEDEASRKAEEKDLTPEQWMERNREDATAATDEALEVYVSEWLRRNRYLLTVEAGELSLTRLAS